MLKSKYFFLFFLVTISNAINYMNKFIELKNISILFRSFLFWLWHYFQHILELKEYLFDDLNGKFEKGEVWSVNYSDIPTKESKQITTKVWKTFLRLLDTVSNILVLNYVFCAGCKTFIHFNSNTTTGLLLHEHKCPSKQASAKNGCSKINFKAEHLIPMRDAAAKFVCIDFRPAYGTNTKGITAYLFSKFSWQNCMQACQWQIWFELCHLEIQ